MMVQKICFFALSAMGLSFGALKWTGPVTISDLVVWDNAHANQNYVNIRVTPFINPESCPDQQGYQLTGSLTSAAELKSFERIYAFLLSAYVSGQKVSIALDGCAPKGMVKGVSFTQPMTP